MAPMTERPGEHQRLCPSCGAVLAFGPERPCFHCGFAPAAGVVRRDSPQQSRGLEAVARRLGTRWSFGAMLLALAAVAIYYFDISQAEATGKSFSPDMFTALAYKLGGKWAALALWSAFALAFGLVD